MPSIEKRQKPLSVNPLKVSQPVGACLAFLGIQQAVPMLHGSQGCTAFAKVFFVRHFREPIPLQTTAMDQVATIMGADDHLVQGLKTIAEKSHPALIGVPTTGLAETQGTDIVRVIKRFREDYPEHAALPVIPVNTPDYLGSLESGFALAVKAIIGQLVPQDRSRVGRRKKQVNVLASSMLTPGDLEALKELIEAFGLRPVILPDLSDALDGHLSPLEFSPVTLGGTPVGEIVTLGEAAATLVIGRSLAAAADLLHERTGVPEYRFDSLIGLAATDTLLLTLAAISGRPVPEKLERQRSQLQDAMVDTHFMLGLVKVAIAADPDLLLALGRFLTEMGCELVAAVASCKAPVLVDVPATRVILGDLEDLEQAARSGHAELLLGNSHATATAQRLDVPLMRAGFPLYDWIGGYQRPWLGYRGARQALFDLANVLQSRDHGAIHPFHATLAPRGKYQNAAAQTRSLN